MENNIFYDSLYLFFKFQFQLILDYFEICLVHCRYDFGLDMNFDHFDMFDYLFFVDLLLLHI